jgi:tetraacyldisaccharide 4'-kinase
VRHPSDVSQKDEHIGSPGVRDHHPSNRTSPQTDGLSRRLQAVWWRSPPTALAWLLWPLSQLYALLRVLHQMPWRMGWKRAEAATVPVLVIGNIVVGGTGKTPTVIALVEGLRQRGWNPGIVSRGYKLAQHARAHAGPVTATSSAFDVGDEPLLMHRRTGAPIWIDRDRPAAVRALSRHHPNIDVVLSDDGRQHLRLHRDAELMIFDERGAGNRFLLPAGPLREPLPRTLDKHTLVLYNATEPSTPLPGPVAQRALGAIRPWTDWWRGTPGPIQTLDVWRRQRWRAVAGIGHPDRFFSMLESAGLEIVRCPLPDHAPMWPRPWPDDGLPVLMTEKDAVKIQPDCTDLASLHVATLDFEIPEDVMERIDRCLRARQAALRSTCPPETP